MTNGGRGDGARLHESRGARSGIHQVASLETRLTPKLTGPALAAQSAEMEEGVCGNHWQGRNRAGSGVERKVRPLTGKPIPLQKIKSIVALRLDHGEVWPQPFQLRAQLLP